MAVDPHNMADGGHCDCVPSGCDWRSEGDEGQGTIPTETSNDGLQLLSGYSKCIHIL